MRLYDGLWAEYGAGRWVPGTTVKRRSWYTALHHMHYMLHYEPKVAGAIKSIIGEYRLTPIDADSTRVNYRLEVRVTSCVYIMRVFACCMSLVHTHAVLNR